MLVLLESTPESVAGLLLPYLLVSPVVAVIEPITPPPAFGPIIALLSTIMQLPCFKVRTQPVRDIVGHLAPWRVCTEQCKNLHLSRGR